ncbi:MAG: hypothetical protein HWE35_03975 [Rhodobacteraceae bacterium]|nr:hypothetical protein [Paracoccaceae bacterium]
MRPENTPTGDFVANFDAITSAKQKNRRKWLSKLRPFVVSRYCEFWMNRAELGGLSRKQWSVLSAKVLRHCYESKVAPLAKMKERFFYEMSDLSKSRCAYCMLREPNEIDHYLPIDVFPEFSVLPANWVHVCGICNRRKGTELTGPPRSILNPYFDGVSGDEALLYAELQYEAGVPHVIFVVPNPNPLHLNPTLPEVAQRQLENDVLKIKSSLEKEGNSALSAIIGVIVDEAPGALSNASLISSLQARRRNLEDQSINGWERSLLEAMETCEQLLAHINQRIANREVIEEIPPARNLNIILRAQAILAAGG